MKIVHQHFIDKMSARNDYVWLFARIKIQPHRKEFPNRFEYYLQCKDVCRGFTEQPYLIIIICQNIHYLIHTIIAVIEMSTKINFESNSSQ